MPPVILRSHHSSDKPSRAPVRVPAAGARLIAGLDEAGRGPLAGPVVAAAVVFEEGYRNPDLRDSKQLSAEEREHLVEHITRDAHGWAIVAVGHERILRHNILRASLLAMKLALCRVRADHVVVDGNQRVDTHLPQEVIVGGDALRVEISAASILAKVYRDWLMRTLDNRYPGYGFARHAGYPTPTHRAAIAALGPCRVHRRAFRGVREEPCQLALWDARTDE